MRLCLCTCWGGGGGSLIQAILISGHSRHTHTHMYYTRLNVTFGTVQCVFSRVESLRYHTGQQVSDKDKVIYRTDVDMSYVLWTNVWLNRR